MTKVDNGCPPCPLCGNSSRRVIYYGLPHYLCSDDECVCLFGFFANITQHLPFNGWLMIYEGMSYWKALRVWLFQPGEEE